MQQSIESILVPTDGSDGAEIGARRGIEFAEATDAEFHVLSVLNTREAAAGLGIEDPTDRRQLLEKTAHGAVESLEGTARSQLSNRVTGAVERGIPHEAINEYVEHHDIDLVVMGTSGRTGVERILLGSVAEKTLRTADVPVVVVPPSADAADLDPERYENVLLPTDGSKGAERAVDWGIALATVFDAMIHTIYSVETSRFAGVEGLADIHEALERTGEEALERVRERARENDVSVAGSIARGPAARTILDHCEETAADLVVMGTHGRSGVSRYLIGSVTETVVRNADVPVCCVPLLER